MGALDPVAVQVDSDAALSLDNPADGPKIAEIVQKLKVQATRTPNPNPNPFLPVCNTRSVTRISVSTTDRARCLGCGGRTGLGDSNYIALVML